MPAWEVHEPDGGRPSLDSPDSAAGTHLVHVETLPVTRSD
jgi:hypothetical protein